MRELRPPEVPDTPEFRRRVEAMLRRAVSTKARVPRMPRRWRRWSTAPVGGAFVGLLAVSFFMNLSVSTVPPGSSLPHWTAPEVTVDSQPAPSPDAGHNVRRVGPPRVERPLIDGRFRRSELRVDSTVVTPPTTVPL